MQKFMLEQTRAGHGCRSGKVGATNQVVALP
jgi:hypothetical protein